MSAKLQIFTHCMIMMMYADDSAIASEQLFVFFLTLRPPTPTVLINQQYTSSSVDRKMYSLILPAGVQQTKCRPLTVAKGKISLQEKQQNGCEKH